MNRHISHYLKSLVFCFCFFVIKQYTLILNLPTTVGSRSTKTALGTCLPAPVSLKKVLKESSPPPMVLSEGIWPSGWIPCSKQYSSQQALPHWTPACPTWIEIHSLWKIQMQYKIMNLQWRMKFKCVLKVIKGQRIDPVGWSFLFPKNAVFQ